MEALLQDVGGANQAPAAEPAAPAEQPAVEGAAAAEAVANEDAAPAANDFADAAVTDEDAALIAELSLLEELRRRSMDDHGRQALENGNALLLAGDNMGARDQYKVALDFITIRPANDAARKEAESNTAEAYYREALALQKKKDLEAAQSMSFEAVQWGHPRAPRQLDAIREAIRINLGKTVVRDNETILSRLNEKDYKDRQDEIRTRLRRSRHYFMTAEFTKAREECELVLRKYPDTIEAITLLDNIAKKMNMVSTAEFGATREKMLQEVTDTWTAKGRYAIESAQVMRGGPMPGDKKDGGRTVVPDSISKKLREIIIPEVSFRPPATIIDAIDFFKQASRDYDSPEIPVDQRGVNLILKLPPAASAAAAAPDDIFTPSAGTAPGVPVIPAMSARFINLYDALKLVCDVTNMKIRITGNIVMIVPFDDPDDELVPRSYNVLPTIIDRINNASSQLPSRGDTGLFTTAPLGENRQEDDLKDFFRQMGVKWPTGSSISYLSAIGKLRVQNTAGELAVFEQILEDLNVTPRLVEIETRFVEVSQEELTSLGFEWLINGDFSWSVGGVAKNLLGLKNVSTMQQQLYDSSGYPMWANTDPENLIPLLGYGPYTKPGRGAVKGWAYDADGNLKSATASGYGAVAAPKHNMGMSPMDGTLYGTRMRYLSTMDNPIGGKDINIPDQFMRLNAFIGGADVSMILHLLQQQSGTDLLSAPKVTTNPGQEAIIKVVTEYIYPSEFRVQISQQGNNGGGGGLYGGGGTGDPVAIVEPQNFTMREVGVILQVIPEVSSEGQMINLTMKPQVVSEPVWKNYGTRLPKTTYQPSLVPGMSDAVTEYVELPMEQPFFNVRSVETQLSIYNGATVVMGGLITEARTTIEDKIPLLGDIPFVGRLFRSRAEQTTKRNLLIFVTAHLVDSEGRKVRFAGDESPLISSSGTNPTGVVIGEEQ
ncbi:MAG: hypothetical protein FWG50_08715 [Kiritimatiellaeota bacterium]|nr:hypothetical protein [Kiritimatiellota bacterium]